MIDIWDTTFDKEFDEAVEALERNCRIPDGVELTTSAKIQPEKYLTEPNKEKTE